QLAVHITEEPLRRLPRGKPLPHHHLTRTQPTCPLRRQHTRRLPVLQPGDPSLQTDTDPTAQALGRRRIRTVPAGRLVTGCRGLTEIRTDADVSGLPIGRSAGDAPMSGAVLLHLR